MATYKDLALMRQAAGDVMAYADRKKAAEREAARQKIEDDRYAANLAYNLERDKIADERYQQEQAYKSWKDMADLQKTLSKTKADRDKALAKQIKEDKEAKDKQIKESWDKLKETEAEEEEERKSWPIDEQIKEYEDFWKMSWPNGAPPEVQARYDRKMAKLLAEKEKQAFESREKALKMQKLEKDVAKQPSEIKPKEVVLDMRSAEDQWYKNIDKYNMADADRRAIPMLVKEYYSNNAQKRYEASKDLQDIIATYNILEEDNPL